MTNVSLKVAVSALAAASFLPAIAAATPISAVEVIQVQGPIPFGPPGGSPVVVDDSETVTNGTASKSIGGFSGNAVSAVQNADGTSEVAAETGRDAWTELSTAKASLTQSETNTTNGAREYFLDYELSGLSTRLFHNTDSGLFGPGPTAPVFANPFLDNFETLITSAYTAASFQYEILVNGSSVFSARADVLENEAGVTTENVENFDVTVTENSIFGSTLFEVDDISGAISLGTFASGETISVESILIARSYATNILDEITNSVGAESSDPVTISSVGTLRSTAVNMAPVPLPAAGWMLIAGVGGLVAAGRRKKA